MEKSHAYRNLKICTKDCLCLFVCPTGATDNETGQIDFEKCIGCGACAAACPAKAITMIPNKMPKPQLKNEKVISEMFKIANSKIEQNQILKNLLNENKEDEKLLKALIHSNKVIIEDIIRESGYMIPQNKNTNKLLKDIQKNGDNSSKEYATNLLNKINFNE